MPGVVAYIENLSDGELYTELKKHGLPVGPVVGKCMLYVT
jgi:hypothetical protein